MHLSFSISPSSVEDFLNHWSDRYYYEADHKYRDNIGIPFTEESIMTLFEWKNGGRISGRKTDSIRQNYPLTPPSDLRGRYLSHKESGGAIWNIFYLHCISPQDWPIFDQHTYRAMKYIQTGQILEIPNTTKRKYQVYLEEYMEFFNGFSQDPHRLKDKAFFAFGQFLKTAKKYA